VITGSISDLKWLNLLLKTPYELAVGGEGELRADVILAAGWPAPGTRLLVEPKKLTVEVLDYVAAGDGRVELEVQKGGPEPDIELGLDIDDARLKRRGEEQAHIENVSMALRAMVRGMRYDRPGGDATLKLKILSASLRDMSVYNRYLPPDSPLEFLRGGADLSADIELTPKSAAGFVKMKTGGLRVRVAGQEVSGDLAADIILAGGVPEKMDFDISGSTLVLDKVRVDDDRKPVEQPDWRARLELKKGHAVWKQPVLVEVQAGLELSDTRPLVEIIAGHKDRPEWLEKLLTVENIQGEDRMTMTRDRVVVPHAFASGEAVDVGAKGSFGARTRDGVFYARFKNLHALLKIRDDDRNLDIFRARETFDRYSPETVTLK
jgi:translocation and assembly module TamB